jgi:hypothetical protein
MYLYCLETCIIIVAVTSNMWRVERFFITALLSTKWQSFVAHSNCRLLQQEFLFCQLLLQLPFPQFFARNHDEVCKKMTLYSLTNPPVKEPPMMLCHPVAKANQANIEFNKGIFAGQAAVANNSTHMYVYR